MNPKVNVLILNWNGKKVINNCVDSVLTSDYNNYVITIIDNGSTDNSIDSFKRRNNIKIIQIKTNLGYAKGYNYAFKKLKKNKDHYYLILNNDTLIEASTITKFVEKAIKNGSNNIFGPRIINLKNRKNWFCGGKISKFSGQTSHIGLNSRNDYVSIKSSVVDYISGCCMFLNKETIFQLKGFKEVYKMYYEDVDLCLRARKEGIICHYFSDIIIYHIVSHSIGGRYGIKKYFLKLSSFIIFLFLNNNIGLFLFYFIINILLFPFVTILFLNRKLLWKN